MKHPLALLGLLGLLLLPAPPATAAPGGAAVVDDPAGDANGVNGQGLLGGFEAGPSTRPASVDGADFLQIRLETAAEIQRDRDAGGNITAVRHVATGLRIRMETAAPVSPTFGPGVVYRVPVRFDECRVFFELFVSGAGAGTVLEHPPGAVLNSLDPDCPGGTADTPLPVSADGTTTTIAVPFDGLGPHAGLLQRGTVVEPYGRPHARTQVGLTTPVIDETKPVPEFEIGSDLPRDVDCVRTPYEKTCSG